MGIYSAQNGIDDGLNATNTNWRSTASVYTLTGGSSPYAGVRLTSIPFMSATAQDGSALYTTTSRFTTAFMRITVTTVTNPDTLELFFIDEVNPDVFSNSRLPGFHTLADEIKLGEVAITTAGTYDIPLLDSNLDSTLGIIEARHLGPGWQGVMAFSLKLGIGGNIAIGQSEGGNGPTLHTTELPFITGLDGPWKAQSRVDRCPKCGRIGLRENWVQDGYSRRLVCKECWDPRDPYERPIRIPEEKPGINDQG